ncbi:glmZ(sRNA)-inactivating NTPase [Dethiosulfatarculus sandiegensis]|uniref:GlmZ(SRNA)-inactivating NTPase n=1 Tax=Dethiosulfatarculus sandiegensis TaxID=1429043 RepID=A0A0D2J8Q6_9BACT|nr:glmZ(sRNA)-inactivating NTPase [Dethiosulfatarculus sandiegensis]
MVITGLSGSGKSTVLKVLEDMGFYAVDNLPVELLSSFVKLPLEHVVEPFKAAMVMDVRARGFVENFPATLKDLAAQGFCLEVLFLEASNDVLLRRYSETRRQHPLAKDEASMEEVVRRERKMLAEIRRQSTQIIDTSGFSIHQLRDEVHSLFKRMAPPAKLQLNLLTFGYKNGLPAEADLVIDVRFLANPFYVEKLRELDGRNNRVVNFIFQQTIAIDFLARLKDLLELIIPEYQRQGKSQITVAIGCTGGRHRSVAVAHWLAENLENENRRVTLRHRDIQLG